MWNFLSIHSITLSPQSKKKTNNPPLHRQQMGGQQRFNQFLKILCCANIFVYGSYCCHQSTRMKALKHEAVQKALAALTSRP